MNPGRALLLALALARPAAAGDETQALDQGVEARVWSPWPASVQKGLGPVYVELRNGSKEEREFLVQVRGADFSLHIEIETRVTVAAGKNASLELLVPVTGRYSANAYVQIRSGDGSAFFGDVIGSSRIEPQKHAVLLVSEIEPAPGELERCAAALSDEAVAPGGLPGIGYILSTGGKTVPATTPTPDDIDVGHTGFGGLPTNSAAYSSLDLVVLDPRGGLPGEEALAPLAAWVRTGGDLLVLGPDAGARLASLPELASWMEPRFETEALTASAYRCGLGRLFVADDDAQLGDRKPLVQSILSTQAGFVPAPGGWRGGAALPRIPDLARLPHRVFALGLVLFALAIGPVNFLLVRRRRKPALLLVTIPAIALVTTVALLLYGIVYQGIDVKSASRSITVLDQRTHRSACLELRQFFAGISPAAGLRPGPGTSVQLVIDGDDWRERNRYLARVGEDTLLTGDYLPSRRTTDQVLAVERAERARLDVHPGGSGWRVDNNLGADVLDLVLRDPEGAYHGLGTLSAGARGELSALGSDGPEHVAEVLGDVPPPAAVGSLDVLPPGCYLARLRTGPFRDDCGVPMNERLGEHVVLGVLDLAPETWR